MNEILLSSVEGVLSNLDSYIELFLSNLGFLGVIFSCLLIVVESIIPVLPLCVFVTLIFYTFGNILGFLISWLCTCFGCFLSFALFRLKIKGWFEKKLINKKVGKQIAKIMEWINDISFSGLTILVAIPFTPAFAVNIAAGLSNISKKKYIAGIMIGKLFMVYFWGYIGTTLIDSITHPIYLIRITIMLFVAFIISKIVNRYFNLD